MYTECVFVTLGIQHAMLMRRILMRGLLDLYSVFPHFLTDGGNFGHKLVNTGFILIFPQILSETFLILRRNNRDIIINVHKSLFEVHVIVISL